MSKPDFIMLQGIPGSGKSAYAQRLVRDIKKSIIFSSDELRTELFGNIDVQYRNGELFTELHRRIKSALTSGDYECVVYDATNINSKRRVAFLNEIKSIDCYKTIIIMATPYEVCLRQNWCRERRVPDDVIQRMYKSWQTPAYWEGWDNIRVELWNDPSRRNAYYHWMSTLRFANYNQCNPHHTETLGQHLISVGRYVEKQTSDDNVVLAAFLHDIGKPFCKTIDDDGVVHYYSHENVGAYDVLCVGHSIDVSLLINHHMKPLSWDNSSNYDAVCSKYKVLWGDDFYNNIMLINEADIRGHKNSHKSANIL